MSTPSYILTASQIAAMDGVAYTHFANPNAQRVTKSLGDATGLTGLGIHLFEVEPGFDTTEFHMHHHADEAIFLLSGTGTAEIGADSLPIGAGDFIGYRKGGLPHVVHNTGQEALRYLVLGERMPFDVTDYPRKGQRMYSATDLPTAFVELPEPAIAPRDTYLLSDKDIADMDGLAKTHFLNPNAKRVNKSLGDATGLTGLGIHIINVEPGFDTTEYHVHYFEDEAVYVLAGTATAELGNETFSIGPGDFIGYRKFGLPHNIRNTGNETFQCLVIGQRLDQDVADYPRQGKRIYRNAGMPWDLADIDQLVHPQAGAKK